jgi:hypothetical protein
MATWVGHGIAGVAVARAMGMGPRATAAAFVLASTPDLDLALGLALEGDAAAYHRAWWAHSPAVAGAGAAVAFAGALAWQRLGGRGGDTREAGRWALLAGLVLLTHTLADFVVINPLRALPYPDFQLDDASDLEALLPALGRELLQQAGDLVFYGALALVALRLVRRARHRGARGAGAA